MLSTLRILTYNIHKGFSAGNRQFVLAQIREQLHAVDVDLVFLQEIHGEQKQHATGIRNWPTGSQFEFLAERVWPHYTYGKNAIYNAGHHGNAILSKYPFERWDNINVSSFRRASRSLLHGVLQIPGLQKPLHVICIHLDFIGHERTRQLRILDRFLRDHVPGDEPLIIAGDFNDWFGRVVIHLGRDLALTEVFEIIHGRHARTYPSWRPLLPVDRIYCRNIEVVECACLQDPPWQRLSDHLPLYAKFRIQHVPA